MNGPLYAIGCNGGSPPRALEAPGRFEVAHATFSDPDINGRIL